jgi:hypothetical protein
LHFFSFFPSVFCFIIFLGFLSIGLVRLMIRVMSFEG